LVKVKNPSPRRDFNENKNIKIVIDFYLKKKPFFFDKKNYSRRII